MKYCGIIAEFNPFTNGHEYIIKEAKKRTGLDVLCLMSGNFVQRGELAFLDKYTRASHAIRAGASIVLELPTAFALSSADDFGAGAVKCIHELKDCSHLAFGVETDNIEFLEKLAKFKANEPKEFKTLIKQHIKNGDSYAVAMYKTFLDEFPNYGSQVKEIFDSPNNILALTYLTAIYKINSNITPVYIKRQDNGYNSNVITKKTINKQKVQFASASLVRNLVQNGKAKKTKPLVPEYVYKDLSQLHIKDIQNKAVINNAIILSSLRNGEVKGLCLYHDYNEGLASLIYNNVNKCGTLTEAIEACTSKAYRESRIKKLVTYPYLGLTKALILKTKNSTAVINVLAVDKTKKRNLSLLKKRSKAKLIISSMDYNALSDAEKELLAPNQRGTNIFNLACSLPKTCDLTEFV